MVRIVRALALGVVSALPLTLVAQATVPTTPRECVEELRAYRNAQIFSYGYFDAPYIPKKEINDKVSVKAKDCIDRFPVDQVKGKQLDALASIFAIGLQDAKAEEIFAKRLGESDLSVRDKGLALAEAVRAFTDADHPERIPTAEKYMKQLDQLPRDVSGQEAAASHMTLGNAYRLIGKGADEISNDKMALVIANKLTQQERSQLMGQLITTYNDIAEAYIGTANPKPSIDSVADLLMKPVSFKDGSPQPDVPWIKEGFDKAVKRGYLLGKTAPNIFSNHWYNIDKLATKPANGVMELKGNIPHVVEFTQFG